MIRLCHLGSTSDKTATNKLFCLLQVQRQCEEVASVLEGAEGFRRVNVAQRGITARKACPCDLGCSQCLLGPAGQHHLHCLHAPNCALNGSRWVSDSLACAQTEACGCCTSGLQSHCSNQWAEAPLSA